MQTKRAHVAWMAAIAVMSGVSAGAGEGETRAAVSLRAPRPRTPVEVAGTGLAPEVRVRVRIDPRGRVVAVDVLDIRPSSEFDAIFRDVTRQTLLQWRFAPRLQGGTPAPDTLEWTVKFPGRRAPDADEGDGDFPYDDALARPGGRPADIDPWRQILGLPEPLRRRLLSGIASSARSHLHPERVRSFESPRFQVFTDATRVGLAEATAAELEATFEVIAGLFQPLFEPRAGSYRVQVYLYASGEAFTALSSEVLQVEQAAGFYNPAGLIACHMGLATPESVVGTLLHEAAHAFFDRHIARPGVVPPRWLGEGFAEYVGNSAIKQGRLIPGKTPRSQIYWSGWRPALGRSEQVFGVERVRAAMNGGTAPTVERLLGADQATFYGAERQLFYTTSWLLVHFLRHGDAAWATGEFPRFMLYVAEGYPVQQAFATVYGVSPAEIEARFREYVKKF